MLKESDWKEKVLKGFVWKFSERLLAQIVTFIVSIILARLLTPKDYGIISLVMVFISIANVFVESGLGNALIQKKSADKLDFSSVFYFNLLFSIILYWMVWLLAPYIAAFYHNKTMTYILRLLGLRIPIAAVNSVQKAYISKHMMFKRFFFSTLGGTIGAAIVGIILAYRGAGVFALVIQYLFNAVIDTIILWMTVKWRPKLSFSFQRVKNLFQYGWKLLCSSLLETFYNELRNFIIGKLYSPTDLAFYNRGKQYPDLVVTNISISISTVLFPAIAENQNNKNVVRNITKRAISIGTFIITPILVGLILVAKPLILIMLTEKWLPCVPYLQIICLANILMPAHIANLEAMKAIGRSDIFLKLELLKKVIGILFIVISIPYGVLAIAGSLVFSSIVSFYINAFPNKKLLDYDFKEQVYDILPALLLSFGMAIPVYIIGEIVPSILLAMLGQILFGIVIYIGLSKLFKVKSFLYLFELIKTLGNK